MNNNFMTDISIFTNKNENGIKLADRLNTVLSNSQYFDILVGYFRLTGFYLLREKLENVEEIRILIGLNGTLDYQKQVNLSDISNPIAKQHLKTELINEFNESQEDSIEMENGIVTLCKWIASGKLKMRMCYDKNVHAKLYIVRKNHEIVQDHFGTLITGSSNFSYNGLEKNVEFNVELKNRNDVEYALNFFDDLWSQSIDISFDVADIIKSDTWMNQSVTPYELYLKTIFAYFEEEVKSYEYNYDWPEGYLKLKYQEDAVSQARRVLAKHGGVFISDVVGLGKTYISAMLGKFIPGRKLFIVPPVVKENWESVLSEFGYKMNDKVVSLGIVDQISEWEDLASFEIVFIDEAHRFRNSSSQMFQHMKKICYGKKVVLITATPQNNTILDIASLITLFQDTRNSSIIPNNPNIDIYFSMLKKKLDKAKNNSNKQEIYSGVAADIRDNVLRHVLIRRTRGEIQKYYSKDLESQNLFFPILNNPVPLTYMYDTDMEEAFNETIELLQLLTYARYTPLLYLKDKMQIGSNKARQENMKGFIKTMLIKRLESSIYAFSESIRRLIESSKGFINLFNQGKVVVGASSRSKKYGYDDFLGMSDEQFELALELNDIDGYNHDEFTEDMYNNVLSDHYILEKIYSIWTQFNLNERDTKYKELKKQIENWPNERIIIFTEAKDTVSFLTGKMMEDFGDCVISYSGGDSSFKKQHIVENFDPQFESKKVNDKRILVTTDALSEGVNLHKAAVLINYDLPWNPTRIMQRIGRINRVGSSNKELFVFNFFPRANTKNYLSLEEAIKAKIFMFHELLGEDSQYLTNEEKVGAFGLYDLLMTANKLPDDDEIATNSLEMSLIQTIDNIKRNNKELFDRIRNLPDKIRVGRMNNHSGMITFIKKGLIKKFIYYNNSICEELEFEKAISMLMCEEDEKRYPVNSEYYIILNKNKDYFEDIINESRVNTVKSTGGKSEKKVKLYLRLLRNTNNITEVDRILIEKISNSVQRGALNSKIYNKIISEIGNTTDIDIIISAFRNNVDDLFLEDRNNYQVIDSFQEKNTIVLSEYFIK